MEREEPLERRPSPSFRVRKDHLLHHRQALVPEEHVLGAAEPDPLCSERPGTQCILRSVRVGADAEPSSVVGPREHRLEVLARPQQHERDGADEDATRSTVDRDEIAFDERVRPETGGSGCLVDLQVGAACDTRLPHAAGDDGRMGGHSSVHGQDPLGGKHPVNVVRCRLVTDEQDRPCFRALDCSVCVEYDPAARRAGRGVQALAGRLDCCIRVDHRVQELIELCRVDAGQRFVPGDQPFLDHRHGCLERGRGRSLRRSGLQEVQAIVLDRELDVLHVAVVPFQVRHRVDQLGVRIGKQCLHRLDRLRRPDARNHVLALGVREKLSVRPLLGLSTGHA